MTDGKAHAIRVHPCTSYQIPRHSYSIPRRLNIRGEGSQSAVLSPFRFGRDTEIRSKIHFTRVNESLHFLLASEFLEDRRAPEVADSRRPVGMSKECPALGPEECKTMEN